MEKEIILRAQMGSAADFGRIMNIYSPRIYNAAYGFLRNVDDARDVCQDVFIRAYRSLDRFNPDRPLYPWLHRITRNLCINRSHQKVREGVSLPEQDILPAKERTPEHQLLRKQQEIAVREAVDRLPEKHREIVILKHFQDCSYEEIAEILEIPIGTVMSRLYHARLNLRKALEEVVS